MSRHGPIPQEYAPSGTGRRIPAHTPRLSSCRCKRCWAARWWTPERRAARALDLQAQYRDGRRLPHRDGNLKRAEHWQPEQDAAIRELAGQFDVATIAQRLTDRFGQPRTEAAVRHRIKRLGILLFDRRPLTASEVGRAFGITRETVRRRLVGTGLLVGTEWKGGPHGMRMFTRAEVERLIREHPEAYEVAALRDPGFRALAEAVQRGRRLISTTEVERLTGVNYRDLARWYADGLVPTARRVEGVRRGRYGTWLIEASDLATVRRLDAEHAERRRRRAEACPSGHSWAESAYIEPSTGQRRCLVCRRARRLGVGA